MTGLIQDLRYAVRRLLRTPGFTLTTVGLLAIGIGASTALFSVIDGLALRPLPLEEPGRLVKFAPVLSEGERTARFSYPQFTALRERTRQLTGLAAATSYEFSFRDSGPAEGVPGSFVSANYFEVLGVTPALGRFFIAEEDQLGGPAALVVSHRMWQERLRADPGIVGRTIWLKDVPFTVVGVAPRGLATERLGSALPDVWVPFGSYTHFAPESVLRGAAFMLTLVGRLADGVTPDHGAAELFSILEQSELDRLFHQPISRVQARPLDPISADVQEGFARHVVLLGTATGLLMVLAAANVAGMMLARGASRRREFGIRRAIGSGEGRIVRQLLTEGVLVFLLGGAAGILIAAWIQGAIAAYPWPVPLEVDLPLDARVLAFSLGLALIAGVLFNLAPALQSSRIDLTRALKEISGGQPRGRSPLRSTLIVLQVAIALVLLLSAGLFAQALQRAWKIDPGFAAESLIAAEFNFRTHGSGPEREAFLSRVADHLLTVPGVSAAALSTVRPFSPLASQRGFAPEGVELPSEFPYLFLPYNVVTPEYFRTMGIPLALGRGFSEADQAHGGAAVINRALVERLWPGENPIGKVIDQSAEPVRVVGVVEDVRAGSLAADPEPMLYELFSQETLPIEGRVQLYVRLQDATPATVARVRQEIRSLDPALPAFELTPVMDQIAATLLPQRVGARLVGGFGMFGVLVTVLGLYGIVAHDVVRRTREIGVRIALGAERERVVREFAGRGLRICGAGLALGMLASWGSSRLIASYLYGFDPVHPPTYVAGGVLLLAVAALACIIPARRAATVDPMVALRYE